VTGCRFNGLQVPVRLCTMRNVYDAEMCCLWASLWYPAHNVIGLKISFMMGLCEALLMECLALPLMACVCVWGVSWDG
jgi:hypothetical protein